MNGITVLMALVDFLPVLLFFTAAIILQRDLYNKMVKGAFALLAAGSLMVLISGIYKAAWKILYAMNICDFTALDAAFFPMQAPGFLLVFAALMAMLCSKNKCKMILNPFKALARCFHLGKIIVFALLSAYYRCYHCLNINALLINNG